MPKTPGDTRWHYYKSPDYIATPYGLSLSETLQPGDLFLHEHTVTGLVRAWVWMSEGVWTPALEGLEHPTIQERRLWFNDGRHDWGKVTPGWVTERTVTTYRSRLRRADQAKGKLSCVLRSPLFALLRSGLTSFRGSGSGDTPVTVTVDPGTQVSIIGRSVAMYCET